MKFLFVAGLLATLCSCSGSTASTTSADSSNAIDNHVLDTVTSSSQPDGYTPPNTKVDTSQAKKDSINARHKR